MWRPLFWSLAVFVAVPAVDARAQGPVSGAGRTPDLAPRTTLVPAYESPVPIERITLADALRRSANVDPTYVTSLGRVANASWARRAARLAFFVPSLSAQLDGTKFSRPFFNIGIGAPSDVAVNARVNLSYEILSLRKFADLTATDAGLDAADAGLGGQTFLTALNTERDFYQVMTDRELLRVAAERLDRAQVQLGVARSRVLTGAAVQSDSLTLVTESVQAEIAAVRQQLALDVSRAQLGRRVGANGPVDADAEFEATIQAIPVTLADALQSALEQGPQYRQARALERQSKAQIKAARSGYFPTLTLAAANQTFDSKFFPTGSNTSQAALIFSVPIWNLGVREAQLTAARVNATIAQAVRQDLERGAFRDVLEAHGGYETQRRIVGLADQAVAAAAENYRVQDLRYRAGATTILELLEAQFRLAQAEGDAVQARFGARLALASLETILGRRLSQP